MASLFFCKYLRGVTTIAREVLVPSSGSLYLSTGLLPLLVSLPLSPIGHVVSTSQRLKQLAAITPVYSIGLLLVKPVNFFLYTAYYCFLFLL